MTTQEIINEIHKLPPTQQKEVLDSLVEKPTEAETADFQVQKALFEAGLLQEIKPRRRNRIGDFPAIEIDGETVSEAIIRERI